MGIRAEAKSEPPVMAILAATTAPFLPIHPIIALPTMAWRKEATNPFSTPFPRVHPPTAVSNSGGAKQRKGCARINWGMPWRGQRQLCCNSFATFGHSTMATGCWHQHVGGNNVSGCRAFVSPYCATPCAFTAPDCRPIRRQPKRQIGKMPNEVPAGKGNFGKDGHLGQLSLHNDANCPSFEEQPAEDEEMINWKKQ